MAGDVFVHRSDFAHHVLKWFAAVKLFVEQIKARALRADARVHESSGRATRLPLARRSNTTLHELSSVACPSLPNFLQIRSELIQRDLAECAGTQGVHAEAWRLRGERLQRVFSFINNIFLSESTKSGDTSSRILCRSTAYQWISSSMNKPLSCCFSL